MAIVLRHSFADDLSLVPAEGTGTPSCIRASDAYYYDANGQVASVSTSTARFGHTGLGVARGLMIEEPRTNLIINSNYAGSGSGWQWAASVDATITQNTASAPDGTTTAFSIEANTTTSAAQIVETNVTLLSTNQYTLSAFVKAGTTDWVHLLGSSMTVNFDQWFDLTNGVAGSLDASIDEAFIEELANGWYRVAVTWTTGADATGDFAIRAAAGDSDDALTSGDLIYCWQTQAEVGGFASSIIPTSGSTVTRGQEEISLASPGYFSTTMSVFLEWEAASPIKSNDVGQQVTFEFYEATGNLRMTFTVQGDKACDLVCSYNAGGGTLRMNGADASSNPDYTLRRWAAAIAEDDSEQFVDGGTDTDTDVACDIQPTCSKVVFGSSESLGIDARSLNGYLKTVVVWDERLSAADLEGYADGTLTVGGSDHTAWVDYIPVYVVTGRTKRWRTDDNEGFIPVVYQ